MTKAQLQYIFNSNLNLLSYEARLLIAAYRLDKFEIFYYYFIENKKSFSWGYDENKYIATKNELTNFVNVIKCASQSQILKEKQSIEGCNKNKELLFNIAFEKLTVRTKNILGSIRINELDSFVKFIRINGIEELYKIRNCGTKSVNEIEIFKDEILKIVSEENKEIDFFANEATFILEQEVKAKGKIITSLDFNGRTELFFDREFDKLNVRAQNILISINSNQLRGFVNNVINNENCIDLINIRNCGEKTKNEIEIFKDIILREILCNENSLTVSKFFENLDIYFKERDVLKKIEIILFNSYYCFIKNNSYEPLALIAKNSHLTTERVRQISVRLFEKIIKIIKYVFLRDNYLVHDYFREEAFSVSKSLTDSINKIENTNFSSAFITIVMSQINTEEYDFISTDNDLRTYSGIFFKKSNEISYKKCYEYLSAYLDSRRQMDMVYTFDELIKMFSLNKNYQITDEIKRKQVYSILSKIIMAIPSTKNKIEIDEDAIIMRRNIKKLRYEYLVDILNTYKRPMHFSELFKECLVRNIEIGSDASVHSTMLHYPTIFGLKGPGIYGLIEWGGYFGSIGDVTEKLLRERNGPIEIRELKTILCGELYISQDSILNVLLRYENEKRFVLLKNNMISLKEWS